MSTIVNGVRYETRGDYVDMFYDAEMYRGGWLEVKTKVIRGNGGGENQIHRAYVLEFSDDGRVVRVHHESADFRCWWANAGHNFRKLWEDPVFQERLKSDPGSRHLAGAIGKYQDMMANRFKREASPRQPARRPALGR
ncbi:hypothetical protein [Gluconacetobacter tumulicola]|uniref:Uncharacterized protein n=1 Tax=Gluconacetobacter tumulicola TaxID=1017177 RepID=A0A7W4JF93_9PROT|nr:hypothetical protein [Gluconacetobacter tumulicola]MBB2180126.1 hypothetical protein [Gluconacetobacter tumulicola]